MVLARPLQDAPASQSKTAWTIPDVADFHDLVNRADPHIVSEKLSCITVAKWSNLWGKVGLLGLSGKRQDLLEQHRDVIENLPTNKLRFTIFP